MGGMGAPSAPALRDRPSSDAPAPARDYASRDVDRSRKEPTDRPRDYGRDRYCTNLLACPFSIQFVSCVLLLYQCILNHVASHSENKSTGCN